MTIMQQLRTKGPSIVVLGVVTNDVAGQAGCCWGWPEGQIWGEKALDVRPVKDGDSKPAKVTGVASDHRRINESRVCGVARDEPGLEVG